MTVDDAENKIRETTEPNKYDLGLEAFDSVREPLKEELPEKSFLSSSYEKMFDIYGRFQQETLELRLNSLK
jgi:hypothetical protein